MFFNPSSGVKRRQPGELSRLQDAASAAGLEVIRLTRDLDVPSLVRERMQRGQTLFVAAGGDGTINSVIQALVHSESILGVIPVGTYNHFARDLGLPLDWRDALDVAVSGATRQVDSARINERFFVNNVSMGLYPELVAQAAEIHRWTEGEELRFLETIAGGLERLEELFATGVKVIPGDEAFGPIDPACPMAKK